MHRGERLAPPRIPLPDSSGSPLRSFLWLRSAAKVAHALSVERLTGRPAALPVAALPAGTGTFRPQRKRSTIPRANRRRGPTAVIRGERCTGEGLGRATAVLRCGGSWQANDAGGQFFGWRVEKVGPVLRDPINMIMRNVCFFISICPGEGWRRLRYASGPGEWRACFLPGPKIAKLSPGARFHAGFYNNT
jgi:hypothetical protein